MDEVEDVLTLIPDMNLDLTRCRQAGVHGLPPPIVVTLSRRPDRWAAAQHRFAQRGIRDLVKAPAVDGQLLAGEIIGRLLIDPMAVDQPLEHYLQMTRPAVGCFLSHLAIWKQFLASGAPFIFIAEDDAVPAAAFSVQRARTVLASMPADTDILLLGGTVMDGLSEPTADVAFERVYYYNGTYAYVLTRKGCLALLPRMLPLATHIDNQISLALVKDRASLHVYAVEPRLFEHDFTVWSDVYVPVADTRVAERTLASIFAQARERLKSDGARLRDAYTPA
jgi:glycosyl transferase, family 25